MDFDTYAQRCAPAVHPRTLMALVRHESGFDPLAIGVNSHPPTRIRPGSREEAVAEVRRLIEQGANFDAGYGQINVRNWKWLGLTPETVFHPCVNLEAAQNVLLDCYRRAIEKHLLGQPALHAALSCYNTGNFTTGLANGYVGKVIAASTPQVPAINAASLAAKRLRLNGASPLQASKPVTKPDAFSTQRADAFAKPSLDAFSPGPTQAADEAGPSVVVKALSAPDLPHR